MKLKTITSNLFKKRKIPKKITIFLFLFTFSTSFIHAQGKMKIADGIMIKCPKGTKDVHTKHGFDVPQKKAQRTSSKEKTTEFIVTFGEGAESNPEAKAAFQFVLDIWASEIVSSVPIRVFADFKRLSSGVLAQAGPDYLVSEFDGAPDPSLSYPAALANSLAGEILFPNRPYELSVELSSSIDFYFGTDGNTPSGQFDFVTVALHEIGHGLGFIAGSFFDTRDGAGSFLTFEDQPIVFTKFLVNNDNLRLLDLPDPSVELGSLLISNNLFIDGENAVNAFSGKDPRVYAPIRYSGGSSISHWDEDTFPAGDPNSLMTPRFEMSESIIDIGNITRGLFKDMGWVLNDSGLFSFSVSEDVAPFEVNKGESIEKTVVIKNVSDQELIYNVTLSNNPSELPFVLDNAESITLLPGEEKTVTITLDTSLLESDLYLFDINVSTNISTIEIQRSLRIGILDEASVAIIDTADTIEEELDVITKTFSNSLKINN